MKIANKPSLDFGLFFRKFGFLCVDLSFIIVMFFLYGYCILNSVAIGAVYAQKTFPKVAVVDFDVHHGIFFLVIYFFAICIHNYQVSPLFFSRLTRFREISPCGWRHVLNLLRVCGDARVPDLGVKASGANFARQTGHTNVRIYIYMHAHHMHTYVHKAYNNIHTQ